ncbi:MAG: VCBS repeat-containing protein, partial [Bdellovibrionales bacterium]|nr:VCBS repeat-containing protein [Bdellovibrionales bacterium]
LLYRFRYWGVACSVHCNVPGKGTMKLTLGQNITQLMAAHRLEETSNSLSSVLERLSSGVRINRASDDPAGLALGESLRSETRLLGQAYRNTNDAISLLSVYEGAVHELSGIVQRQMELAEQAANGVVTDKQRGVLNAEMNALGEEYNRILRTTSFNGISLFENVDTSIQIQVGTSANDSISLSLDKYLDRTVGDMTFQAETTLAVPANFATSVKVGDLNNDGKNDLVTYMSGTSGGPHFAVQIGNGDGTFQAAQLFSGASGLHSELTLGDLNNDGFLDIVGSRDGSGSIIALLGNGDGTFQAGVSAAVAAEPEAIELGDFNGDGILDAVTANQNSGTMSILLGRGDGTFQTSVSIATVPDNAEIAVGDFNGDGKLDAAVATWNGNQVKVLFGNGDGTFSTGLTLSQVDALGLDATDFNNDGITDLVASGAGTMNVYLGTSDGTFTLSETITGLAAAGGRARSVEAADFNGDGLMDVAVSTSTNGGTDKVYIYQGDGEGGLTLTDTQDVGASLEAFNHLLGTGDLNGDGAADIVRVNHDDAANDLSLLFANTTQSQYAPYIRIYTKEEARLALEFLGEQATRVQEELGSVGAQLSRLQFTASSILQRREHLSEAVDRIFSVDVAQEVSEMIRLQILQNAQVALASQANLNSELVLQLLNGNSKRKK